MVFLGGSRRKSRPIVIPVLKSDLIKKKKRPPWSRIHEGLSWTWRKPERPIVAI